MVMIFEHMMHLCMIIIDSFEILFTNTIKSTIQTISTINNTSGNINSNSNNSKDNVDNESDVKTPAGVVQMPSNTSFYAKDTNINDWQINSCWHGCCFLWFVSFVLFIFLVVAPGWNNELNNSNQFVSFAAPPSTSRNDNPAGIINIAVTTVDGIIIIATTNTQNTHVIKAQNELKSTIDNARANDIKIMELQVSCFVYPFHFKRKKGYQKDEGFSDGGMLTFIYFSCCLVHCQLL